MVGHPNMSNSCISSGGSCLPIVPSNVVTGGILHQTRLSLPWWYWYAKTMFDQIQWAPIFVSASDSCPAKQFPDQISKKQKEIGRIFLVQDQDFISESLWHRRKTACVNHIDSIRLLLDSSFVSQLGGTEPSPWMRMWWMTPRLVDVSVHSALDSPIFVKVSPVGVHSHWFYCKEVKQDRHSVGIRVSSQTHSRK